MERSTWCLECARGEFQDELGQTACIKCAAGKYRDGRAASSRPEPEACTVCDQSGAGTYQPRAGETSCIAKATCAVGEGEIVNGLTIANRQCAACESVAAGHFPRAMGGTFSEPGAPLNLPCLLSFAATLCVSTPAGGGLGVEHRITTIVEPLVFLLKLIKAQ